MAGHLRKAPRSACRWFRGGDLKALVGGWLTLHLGADDLWGAVGQLDLDAGAYGGVAHAFFFGFQRFGGDLAVVASAQLAADAIRTPVFVVDQSSAAIRILQVAVSLSIDHVAQP